MRRAVALAVLLSLSVVAGASPAHHETDGTDRASNPIVAPSDEFNRTRFTIRVFHNGTARWTFRYMRYLPDNESVTAFRDYADRFESEETQLSRDFDDRATALARIGRNQTGREMRAEGFSRRAYVDRGLNDVGVVQLSFQWTAFAQVEGPRVVVGDVFEGGLFLGRSQSLVVKPGPDLLFESVAPNGTLSAGTLAESDSVTWQGEREFSDERPRVVFVSTSAVDGTSTRESPTAGTTTGVTATPTTGDGSGAGTQPPAGGTGSGTGTTAAGAGDGGGVSPILLAVGTLIVIGGLVGGIAYRKTGGDSEDGASTASTTTDRGPAESADATEPAVPMSAMLSDEERVITLLEENGGRMHQVDIVEETAWSKSKVSMLLSDMEDEGTISKLRMGRENIVSLAGHEPDAAGSPFDEPDDHGREEDAG